MGLSFLVNWNILCIDCVNVNLLENRMSLSSLVSGIWDFLLEISWSLLIGDLVDWNNSSLDNIVKTLLEKI